MYFKLLLSSILILYLSKADCLNNRLLMTSRSSSRALSIPFDVAESLNIDNQVNEPYRFSYKVQDNSDNMQFRNEEKTLDGQVKGSYGYKDANGIYRMVEYYADSTGFHAKIHSNEPGVIAKRDHNLNQINRDLFAKQTPLAYNPANVEWSMNSNQPDFNKLSSSYNNYNGDWKNSESNSPYFTREQYALNGGDHYDSAASQVIESHRLSRNNNYERSLNYENHKNNEKQISLEKQINLEKQKLALYVVPKISDEKPIHNLEKTFTTKHQQITTTEPSTYKENRKRITGVRRVSRKNKNIHNSARIDLQKNQESLSLKDFSVKFPEKWHQIFSSKSFSKSVYDNKANQFAQLEAVSAKPDVVVLADQSFMKLDEKKDKLVAIKKIDRIGVLPKKLMQYEPPINSETLLTSATDSAHQHSSQMMPRMISPPTTTEKLINQTPTTITEKPSLETTINNLNITIPTITTMSPKIIITNNSIELAKNDDNKVVTISPITTSTSISFVTSTSIDQKNLTVTPKN